MKNPNQPFGLPEGTVRGLLAILWTFGVFAMLFLGRESEAITGIAGMILGFYFKGREQNGQNGGG